MHLIGELVISNSGLKIVEETIANRFKDQKTNTELSSVTDKLINISSELQNSIMKTRMLPISSIFNQFNRIVRDLSKKENKNIELIIEGGDTEMDKKVIDSIGDPLMHLVRNSIDHGIEIPTDRKKNKKSPQGTIILSAAQSGNHIVLSITDDGKGIDIERVKEKAVKKGFITRHAAEDITRQQLLNLIFEPGFSTSEKVSSVSGRGVGLDVVKSTVGKLNGTVEIETKKGSGTEFIITLPLTLAITSVIMIRVEGDNYAIPITEIEETLRLNNDEIQTLQGIKAIKLRDEVLPIINLDSIFNKTKLTQIEELEKEKKLSVVVVSYRGKKTGLIVDKVIGKQEIVLKPLEEHYQSLEGLSGAAILGDGKILLIIDVAGVINIIKDTSEKLVEITRAEQKKAAASLKKKDDPKEKETLEDENPGKEETSKENKAKKELVYANNKK